MCVRELLTNKGSDSRRVLSVREVRYGEWRPLWLLLAVCFVGLQVSAHAQTDDDGFRAVVSEFGDANFREKEAIAERLLDTGHASARAVLTALLEGRFFVRDQDQQPFIVESTDEDLSAFALVDVVSLESAGSAEPDQLSRVITNNRLRRFLRITIARFALSSPDVDVRVDAVKQMLRSLDEASIELLRERAAEETESSVLYEIDTALALADLDEGEAGARLAAAETLSDRLSPDAYNRLSALLERDEDGNFVEADEAVRLAATEGVRRIDSARDFYSVIETIFFGLSLGSVLALVAIGLTITFGVMGVINLAHGELLMLGAYTTYVVQLAMPEYIDLSILVAIPVAFVVTGLVGVLIERTIIRFLYGRPLETLLATFGVSLVLQQFVRTVFTANNRPVVTPTWMSGTLQFNEAFSLTYNRLYTVLFTLIVFAILLTVLKRTRIGLEMRAVSQNRLMARAMGVRSEWVDAMTFGLGAGIAGVAGVALTQLTNVGPNLGQSYIVDSFMVVVFGGVGNIWGTLIGGMSLGIVNKVLEPFAGAVLGKIFVLVAVILFIQRFPRGLFPQTGRAAEDS